MQVYFKQPQNFQPKVQAVSLIVQFNDEILLLKKNHLWSVPGGKIKGQETPLKALSREIYEETKIDLKKELINNPFVYYFVHDEFGSYTLHSFYHIWTIRPKISLSDEHEEFKWVKINELEQIKEELLPAQWEVLFHNFFRPSEQVHLVPYNKSWPQLFEDEKQRLEVLLDPQVALEIHHFGSTAVEHLIAKPIIDIALKISSFEQAKTTIIPILQAKNYFYIWRNDQSPEYITLIKFDQNYERLYHIHMAPNNHPLWDRLYFRDYLIQNKQIRQEYAHLKENLQKNHFKDRELYTQQKGDFIKKVTQEAKAKLSSSQTK